MILLHRVCSAAALVIALNQGNEPETADTTSHPDSHQEKALYQGNEPETADTTSHPDSHQEKALVVLGNGQ